MISRISRLLGLGVLVFAGCSADGASPSGARQAADETAVSAVSSPESTEILAREPVTQRAEVLHVLIGWDEKFPAYNGRMDWRGRERTKAEADRLATEILKRARSGEEFRALMKEHSEDNFSSDGASYAVSPDAELVKPFKSLSLRLELDETGVVESVYGWHVIRRID